MPEVPFAQTLGTSRIRTVPLTDVSKAVWIKRTFHCEMRRKKYIRLHWQSETRIASKFPTTLQWKVDATATSGSPYRRPMHVQSSGFLNPTTLAILETAFDDAWATLNGNGDLIR